MKFVKKLSSNSKTILTDLMRSSKNYKVRKRAHCILLSAKKYKIDELASIFEVDRDTVSDWIRRWESTNTDGLYDAPRSGRPPKPTKNGKNSEDVVSLRF